MINLICVLILALMMLAVLTAQDIAMVIIDLQNECTLGTEDGKSQYVNFSLSTWMYWASITHFSVVSFILISAALADITGTTPMYLFERHYRNDPYVFIWKTLQERSLCKHGFRVYFDVLGWNNFLCLRYGTGLLIGMDCDWISAAGRNTESRCQQWAV